MFPPKYTTFFGQVTEDKPVHQAKHECLKILAPLKSKLDNFEHPLKAQ